MNAIDVTITEVGPRDGLQNTKSFMPTAAFWALVNSTPSDDGSPLFSRSQPMTSIAPKAERYFAVSSETFLISF